MTAPNPRPVPYLSVSPISATERGVTIRYVGHDGAFVLHYGDGTSLVASGNRNYKHTYERPGVYQVVARASGTQQLLTQATAVVRAGTTPQGIEWGPAPDNPEIWQARFGEVEPTEVPPLYRIDWGEPFTEPQTDTEPAPGKEYEFVYPTDGPKFPAVTYQDGSGTPTDQGFVQVPFTDDEAQQ